VLLILVAACVPPTRTLTSEVTLELASDAGVVDPALDGFEGLGFRWTVSGDADDCELSALRVENPTGLLRTLAPGQPTWDGRDDAGARFPPGPWAAVGRVECADGASAEAAVEGLVVRAGVTTLDFVDDGTGAAVPLAYHRLDLVTQAVTPIDMPEYAIVTGSAPLDEADGSPRAPLDPWYDAGAPPWGRGAVDTVDRNLPVAVRAGGSLAVLATLATTTLAEDGSLWPASAVPLRALPLGWTRRDDGVVVSPATSPTLGSGEETLTWTFEAQVDGAWVPIPGEAPTFHRVYRTLGPAQLRDGSALGFAPAVAWVGALAELAPVLEGAPATVPEVLDRVRDHLYENRWVVYDPGDTDYSGYSGSYIYWDYTWSELSAWLDRTDGVRLYCHSMSCLLSVLVNHEGAYASQQVLGVGFDTYLTRAAGTDYWQRWSFNSHSVASPDEGLTLWDAAVDLDGDEDPWNEPVTAVAPKGLPYEDYLALLSPDDISIVNAGQCYFR